MSNESLCILHIISKLEEQDDYGHTGYGLYHQEQIQTINDVLYGWVHEMELFIQGNVADAKVNDHKRDIH